MDMKWQCALLQRWLPEYPDGELPALWRAWLRRHVPGCPECRAEAAALAQVVKTIKGAPLADPGPEFWRDMQRELHRQLVHSVQEAEPAEAQPPHRRRWLTRLTLVGAPALAMLAIYLGVQMSEFGPSAPATRPQAAREALAPSPRLAASPKAKAPAALRMEEASAPKTDMARRPASGGESLRLAATANGNHDQDEDADILTWELEPVLTGMNDQEKQLFLDRLEQRKKDGSCVFKLAGHWS
jgi:hypothetical protein